MESAVITGDVIKPINRETVHRICSGQGILNISIAIKELVENSIDAGAKCIDIRLHEYGLDLIEVSDNGSGVRSENFKALTLKHHTSKIREFSDLESVCTMGFRGEALSSLCALTDLTIVTRHATSEHSTKLEYDHNGLITNEAPVARSVGTTVTLKNLFATLPVRRKEYVTNYKKEFTKMCRFLYSYCLVAKGVKFSCTNKTDKGKLNNVVSTSGTNSLTDNIISIFGAKQLSSLIELALEQPNEEISTEFGIKLSDQPSPFKFESRVSSAAHGHGRSAADYQFYFINSRPCEPTKLIKLVNKIYKQYNPNQFPFIYLNVIVQSGLVDVNVTPDKRQIFLEQEKLLLATVKASLEKAYKFIPSFYAVQNTSLNESVRGKKRGLDEKKDVKSFLDSFRKKNKGDLDESNLDLNMELNLDETKLDESKDLVEPELDKKPKNDLSELRNLKVIELCKTNLKSESNTKSNQDLVLKIESAQKIENVESAPKIENVEGPKNASEIENLKGTEKLACTLSLVKAAMNNVRKAKERTKIDEVEKRQAHKSNRKYVSLNTSLETIKESMHKLTNTESEKTICVKFRSKIAPDSNDSAESELNKQISKDMFAKMDIVGQFNYAFIVTLLENDLFIIDQHATDEKYNFEELQRNTVLDSQLLIHPKDLQLTAAHETVLIEHEEVFKKNGFYFDIDNNAEATKKVKMTKIPVSKSCFFGKDDVDEMIFMLKEGDTNCRPSRIRGMFASRACRKSVMVGQSLSVSDMRRLVNHMGEIDQPWNCPHGRPTMRHLVNLDLIGE